MTSIKIHVSFENVLKWLLVHVQSHSRMDPALAFVFPSFGARTMVRCRRGLKMLAFASLALL